MSDNKTTQNIEVGICKERKFSPQHNDDYTCIPLPFDSDINGQGGAWRAWSCILIAHLVKDAIQLASKKCNFLENKSQQSDLRIRKSNLYGKLYKRGKYQTKCPKKYHWKVSLSDDEHEEDLVLSSKSLEFRPILKTVS